MSRLFSVCVYCGARPGVAPGYMHAAQELGRALAEDHMRLVYGAGDVGLMGACARAALAAGGRTFGVIPTHLLQREAARADPSRLVVTETMHERKKVMLMNADAIVVLPGGAGTLDEFFEALTWRQLGLHDKPILLLDAGGYWSGLRALLHHLVDQGFADPSLLELASTVPDVAAAIAALRSVRDRRQPAAV